MTKRLLFIIVILLLAGIKSVTAATLLELPLSKQINVGLGDAITGHDGFGSDSGTGYMLRQLTSGNGAGGYYDGPGIDLVKAGYGPYVNLSKTGARIEYTARYFQGNGNTNPYTDAPIWLILTDADGTTCNMGISYGPRPNPTYPSWKTVTDSLSGASSSLDLSKIVAIDFGGTDWAGKGGDFIQIRNLRLLDNSTRNPITIPAAKNTSIGSTVELTGSVTASFSTLGRIYIQNSDNFSGIQVRSSTLPNEGLSAYIKGTVQKDSATDEVYIQASEWAMNGAGNAKPRFMNVKGLGGTTLNNQTGVTNPLGPNNIGLEVRIAGKVTAKADDDSWVYISDGSLLADGSDLGVRVSLTGIPFLQRPSMTVGHNAVVTGISSIYIDGNAHKPVVLLKNNGYSDPQSNGNEPKTFRVAVINFDPYCPGHGNKRTHDVFHWNNPHTTAAGYINDLKTASGGWCNYKIVSWFDANYHPSYEDGFRWDPDAYITAWQTQTGLHDGTSDYVKLITDTSYLHNQPKTIAQRIADDEIDEVFFFGSPSGSAFWESAMVGPSPFFINGGTYTIPETKRNFAVMGFNYERDVDCMLEDFVHRSECTMSRVYPSPDWWFPTYPATNNWDKFRMIDIRGAGASAVGMCHYAPNSQSDYDWGNTRFVMSTCDDWLYNWPNLKGDSTKRQVNCKEWGNGDMRLHHIWWLTHYPKAPGINPDTRQNNWWKYTCDFNNHPESK